MVHILPSKERMEESVSSFKKRMEFGYKKVLKLHQCTRRVLKAYLGQPRKIIRLIVFIACSITVLFQLAQCFKKLTDPPISTHSKVLINTTMTYPSITICRSPAYRKDVLKKYGLGSSLRWTSEWKNFPFGNSSLSAFWNEATYTHKDILSIYGLNRRTENIEVKSHMSYMGGQCHTLIPLVSTYSSGTSAGYSLMLKHTNPNESDAGWLVYIHEANEIWAETGPQFSGMYEVFWLMANEEIDLKIVAHHIKTISQKNRACVDELSYSEAKCKSYCRWKVLAGLVGCTGPWMLPVGYTSGSRMGVKECDNYQDTRELIRQYLLLTGLSSYATWGNTADNDTEAYANAYGCQSSCLRACCETQYTTFLMNRKTNLVPLSSSVNLGYELTPMQWATGGVFAGKASFDRRNALSPGEASDNVRTNSVSGPFDCTGPGNCNGQHNLENNTNTLLNKGGILNVCTGGPGCSGNVTKRGVQESGSEQPRYEQNGNSSVRSPAFRKITQAAEATVAYSTLKVFYTSKVVSSMEEHWGYDFTQFVADAGGSLGFILGMSVVGAVAIVEQLAETLVAAISGSDETPSEKEPKKRSTGVDVLEVNSVVLYEGMKH